MTEFMIEFKCLKAVFTFNNRRMCSLCYYTENDVSTKVRGRRYDKVL